MATLPASQRVKAHDVSPCEWVGVNSDAVDTHLMDGPIGGSRGDLLHLVQHVHAVNHMREHCVLACNPPGPATQSFSLWILAPPVFVILRYDSDSASNSSTTSVDMMIMHQDRSPEEAPLPPWA